MSKDFFFLVDVNLSSIQRSATPKGNKYIRELLELFGMEPSVNLGYDHEDRAYLMTQAQLAVFTYLRNKCGAPNGYKNLNVRRVSHAGQWGPHNPVDIREVAGAPASSESRAEACKLGPLASHVDALAAEIHRIENGGKALVGNVPVSKDRLLTALEGEWEDARASLAELLAGPKSALIEEQPHADH